MAEQKHPIQPFATDKAGVLRFKENAIVQALLNYASVRGMNLNDIAMRDFNDDDRQQFAQLIGYSLCGYGELPYVDDDAYAVAEAMSTAAECTEAQARIATLEQALADIREALLPVCSCAFGIHPDDLKGGM